MSLVFSPRSAAQGYNFDTALHLSLLRLAKDLPALPGSHVKDFNIIETVQSSPGERLASRSRSSGLCALSKGPEPVLGKMSLTKIFSVGRD